LFLHYAHLEIDLNKTYLSKLLDDILSEVRQKMAKENDGYIEVKPNYAEEYKSHLNRKGGIFTAKTRGNLLGISTKGRKSRYKDYDFCYDVRNQVKAALVDLKLFLETANTMDVDDVMTDETLRPVVRALLPDNVASLIMAKISKMFIEESFHYLRTAYTKMINPNYFYDRTIADAFQLSELLVKQYATFPSRRETLTLTINPEESKPHRVKAMLKMKEEE
jgi:hypothetical protein